jgi:hypothetical protein
MGYSFKLIKTLPRKNRKGKPAVIFDQKKQITLGQHTKQFKNVHLIQRSQFLCIVPLYKVEHVFEVSNSDKNGFDLMSVINIIIDLNIAVYQLDLTLNPNHFNCRNNFDSCARDAANEYVLSKLYMKQDKTHITFWYDFDH